MRRHRSVGQRRRRHVEAVDARDLLGDVGLDHEVAPPRRDQRGQRLAHLRDHRQRLGHERDRDRLTRIRHLRRYPDALPQLGLARRRDVDDLAAKLPSLVLDPAQRARLAAAGRDLVTSAFDWERAVVQMEAILGPM